MTDTCNYCEKETGLKEGVCILHICKKEEMPSNELGRTTYIDSASEVYSFCDLDCLFGWLLHNKNR